MGATPELKPLFPWFGGKRWLAPRVWEWLGADVRRYIEPFAGGLAVLLGRPGGARPRFQEVANDEYGLLLNAWRSLKLFPEFVCDTAQEMLHEAELHARTRRMLGEAEELREKLMSCPDYCDPHLGAWWIWAASSHLTTAVLFRGHRCKPNTTAAGVHRKAWLEEAQATFERVRNVQFLCGDFARVLTPVYLQAKLGPVGVYLDPPYDQGDDRVYGKRSLSDVWDRVVTWCVTNADHPNLRIVLSGYSGCRGQTELESAGMRRVDLVGRCGFSRGNNDNREREACWLSPACLSSVSSGPNTLF